MLLTPLCIDFMGTHLGHPWTPREGQDCRVRLCVARYLASTCVEQRRVHFGQSESILSVAEIARLPGWGVIASLPSKCWPLPRAGASVRSINVGYVPGGPVFRTSFLATLRGQPGEEVRERPSPPAIWGTQSTAHRLILRF